MDSAKGCHGSASRRKRMKLLSIVIHANHLQQVHLKCILLLFSKSISETKIIYFMQELSNLKFLFLYFEFQNLWPDKKFYSCLIYVPR